MWAFALPGLLRRPQRQSAPERQQGETPLRRVLRERVALAEAGDVVSITALLKERLQERGIFRESLARGEAREARRAAPASDRPVMSV